MHDVSVTIDGVEHKAEYEVFENDIVVYFPDGSSREAMLQASRPEPLAKMILTAYAKTQSKKLPK